jgi:hypothetical protein
MNYFCFGMKQVRQNGMNLVYTRCENSEQHVSDRGKWESFTTRAFGQRPRIRHAPAGVFPSGSQASLRPKILQNFRSCTHARVLQETFSEYWSRSSM